ncbi:MAG: tol-pal system protein YbgF [Nitrospiraceae bacterium]
MAAGTQLIVSVCTCGGILAVGLLLSGCAKHADFIELRDEIRTVSKTQEQEQKRQEALQRRLESLEHAKDSTRDTDGAKQRFEDMTARLQKLEGRLARLEDGQAAQPAPARDGTITDPSRAPVKQGKAPTSLESAPMLPGMTAITPTSAFNLAYNDYLNGKYELAVSGFQRFLKDFPSTSLTPNAHYWLGESYYNMKDYVRAMQSFEHVVNEYPGNERVPASLFKLGLSAMETGDTVKSRKYLKRVIEEFSTSDEAKLAKAKLAEIR